MVSMKEIREVAQQIGRQFRPDRVLLFGSYADGSATDDSDVDLLVVLPFDGRPFHKSLEILNRLDIRFPCDLVARPPEDVARRYEQGDPLIRDALDRGKVLYERDGCGVGLFILGTLPMFPQEPGKRPHVSRHAQLATFYGINLLSMDVALAFCRSSDTSFPSTATGTSHSTSNCSEAHKA